MVANSIIDLVELIKNFTELLDPILSTLDSFLNHSISYHYAVVCDIVTAVLLTMYIDRTKPGHQCFHRDRNLICHQFHKEFKTMTDAMIVCLTITYMKLSLLIPPLTYILSYFILIAFHSVTLTSKLLGLIEEDVEIDIFKSYESYIRILRKFKPIEEEDIKNVRALNHFSTKTEHFNKIK